MAFEPGPANPEPMSLGISLQPPFDVMELLPPAAAEKLRLLRQRSADAHAVIPEFDDVRAASMARVEAGNALKRLTDYPHLGGFGLKPDDRQVIAATKTLEKAEAEFRRKQELQTARTAGWQAAAAALSSAEPYLKHGLPSGVQLIDNDGPEPKLLKGENGLLDAIENRRRRVRELKADLHRIRSAPFPSSYAKAKMRAQIEALAMQGAPSVSALIELDREIVWPMQMMRSEVRGGEHPALAFAETLDAVALTAWLHPDALIAALDREIASESDDKAALTHEARAKAEAEVQGDLLAVEREESALVWQAQAEGLPCEHRADINPLALLGLRLVTAPRADPPPTSPEHVITYAGGRR